MDKHSLEIIDDNNCEHALNMFFEHMPIEYIPIEWENNKCFNSVGEQAASSEESLDRSLSKAVQQIGNDDKIGESVRQDW